MSRNYDGLLPLRGINEPIRSEARAWSEILWHRHTHGIPVSPEEREQAKEAMEKE